MPRSLINDPYSGPLMAIDTSYIGLTGALGEVLGRGMLERYGVGVKRFLGVRIAFVLLRLLASYGESDMRTAPSPTGTPRN